MWTYAGDWPWCSVYSTRTLMVFHSLKAICTRFEHVLRNFTVNPYAAIILFLSRVSYIQTFLLNIWTAISKTSCSGSLLLRVSVHILLCGCSARQLSKLVLAYCICTFGETNSSTDVSAALFFTCCCFLYHSLYVQHSATLWISLRWGRLKCAVLSLSLNYMFPLFTTTSFSLCLQGWPFGTAIKTLDFHCGCLKTQSWETINRQQLVTTVVPFSGDYPGTHPVYCHLVNNTGTGKNSPVSYSAH